MQASLCLCKQTERLTWQKYRKAPGNWQRWLANGRCYCWANLERKILTHLFFCFHGRNVFVPWTRTNPETVQTLWKTYFKYLNCASQRGKSQRCHSNGCINIVWLQKIQQPSENPSRWTSCISDSEFVHYWDNVLRECQSTSVNEVYTSKYHMSVILLIF